MYLSKLNKQKKLATFGFSLVELLVIMVIMTITMLPIILSLTQTGQLVKGNYFKSSQNILIASLTDQMDASRPDYSTLFNDASMNTSITDAGAVIPFLRKVDTTNSTLFNRMLYLYSYRDASDPVTGYSSRNMITQASSVFRLRCGNTSGFIDSSGLYWHGDAFAYSAVNRQPGYVTGSSGSTGNSAGVGIVNTVDDLLFEYYREGTGATNLNYSFDIENGNYVVDLYFAELDATVTGSAPHRRLMDFYLENTLANSAAYSAYEVTGGTYRASIQGYEVAVSDNVLNLSIRRNASSNRDARISGIVIYPKREY